MSSVIAPKSARTELFGNVVISICGRVCVSVCLMSLHPHVLEGIKAMTDDYVYGSKERKRLLEKRYGRSRLIRMMFNMEEKLSDEWMKNNSKNCPHCFTMIEVCVHCAFRAYC